jgi:amidase
MKKQLCGAVTALFLMTACQPDTPDTTRAIGEADIDTLQARMEDGTLSAKELTQYYLGRIDALDSNGPGLNAIIEINPDALDIAAALDEERATSGARGRLHGIPVVLKANIDTADKMATSAGSLALRDHRAAKDAFLVAKLREAGAVILAKANLSEWANFRSTRSSSGWSSLGGQTSNPYDTRRNPCGSSSGSAVAVAANLVTVAVGTETDGSIVCPSSSTGIVGIKPTLGLVSRSGIIPLAHSQDTAGPMARSVRDAAILFAAMMARDSSDPLAGELPDELPNVLDGLTDDALKGARIGVQRNYSGAGVDERVDQIFNDSIELMRKAGAEIVDDITIDTQEMGAAEYEVLLYEFKADLNAYLGNSGASPGSLEELIRFNEENAAEVMPIFGQEIFLAAQEKGPLTDTAYLEALEMSKAISRNGIDQALAKNNLDAIIAPTLGPAWLTDHINGDQSSGISSSSLAAVSGYPAVTVPAGYVAGLPVGISFFGAAFSDARLVALAYGFEQRSGARVPPGLAKGQ